MFDQYDEKTMNAFDGVRKTVNSLRINPFQLSRYGSIVNAIEVQLENGVPCKESVEQLRAALFSVMQFDGLEKETQRVKKAFEKFDLKVGSGKS